MATINEFLDTGKYSQQNYAKTVDLDELDIVLVLTTTWFKEKHCDFGKMISKDLEKKVIFIRTKLDDSITNDRNRIKINNFDKKRPFFG